MSVLQNKLLYVKLVSNKQRDRQRGKSVVNSSHFTHFICHNGSWAFVPVRSTRRVLADIHMNNCPTRCNTKQSIYYSANSFYTFRLSTTPITRSTQNCNLPPTWSSQLCHVGGRQLHKNYDQYRRLQLQYCVLVMIGVVGNQNMQSELAEY